MHGQKFLSNCNLFGHMLLASGGGCFVFGGESQKTTLPGAIFYHTFWPPGLLVDIFDNLLSLKFSEFTTQRKVTPIPSPHAVYVTAVVIRYRWPVQVDSKNQKVYLFFSLSLPVGVVYFCMLRCFSYMPTYDSYQARGRIGYSYRNFHAGNKLNCAR